LPAGNKSLPAKQHSQLTKRHRVTYMAITHQFLTNLRGSQKPRMRRSFCSCTSTSRSSSVSRSSRSPW
jgi:hypothetical protein